jgi:hypothetical protein
MEKLSNDVYTLISKFLSTIDDMKAMKSTCKNMYASIPTIQIKIAYMNKLQKNEILYNCLNNDCPSVSLSDIQTLFGQTKYTKMGPTVYYFEKNYKGPRNKNGRPLYPDKVPKIIYSIPYCYVCSQKYMEIFKTGILSI